MTTPDTLTRPGEYASPDDLAKAALQEVTPAADPPAEPTVDNRDPIEKWREGLKAMKITEAQAEAILDSMLAKGYWERDYKLFGGKVTVRLRTRDVQNLNRILSVIDRMRLPNQVLIDENISILNLAGSLVKLRDVTLPHPDLAKATVDEIEDAFDKRQEFVRRISGPLMPALRTSLYHFDAVVTAALANGAAEGF